MRLPALALGLSLTAITAACAHQRTDAVPDDPAVFGDTKRSCDAEGNTIIVVTDSADIYRLCQVGPPLR